LDFDLSSFSKMCSHGDHNGGPCSHSVANFDYHQEGIEYLMEAFIDRSKMIVLNEEVEATGAKVFKKWADRFDKTFYVDSDVDEELLFIVPFTGHVKLTGITFIGDMSDSHPSRVRIFKDRELNFSFDSVASAKPDQEMQLKQDDSASIDYSLIASKFSNVSNIVLHFPENFGAEKTRIFYVGLRGEFQQNFRDKVTIATYEARPVPDDHKADLKDPLDHFSGVC